MEFEGMVEVAVVPEDGLHAAQEWDDRVGVVDEVLTCPLGGDLVEVVRAHVLVPEVCVDVVLAEVQDGFDQEDPEGRSVREFRDLQ
jgi:hypothetical protein